MKINKSLLLVIFSLCVFFSCPAYSAVPSVEKKLPFGQTMRFYAEGLKRFLNTSPHVIAVQKLEDGSVEVSTNNIGEGVLILWAKDGRYVFKIDVVRPVPPPSQSSILNKFNEKRDRYFIFSADMYHDFYDSTRETGSVSKQNVLYGEYSLFGPTYFGQVGVFAKAKQNFERDREEILDQLTFYLDDGKIGPVKNLSLEAGDFNQKGGDKLLPSLRLKGLNVKNTRDFQTGGFMPEKISLFYGNIRGQSLYNGVVFSPELEEEGRVASGMELNYRRKPFIRWLDKNVKMENNLIYRHTVNNSTEDSRNDFLFEHKSSSRRNNFEFNIINFDVLSSLQMSLYGGDEKWQYGVDIDNLPHMEGDYPQTGKRRIRFSTDYSMDWESGHFRLESMGAEYELRQDYIQTDLEDGYSDFAYGYALNTEASSFDVKIKAKYSLRDNTNLIVSNIQKDMNIYLNRYINLWRKINTYFNYNLRKTEGSSDPALDRETQSMNWGASFFPVKPLRFYYSGSTSSTSGPESEKLTENNAQSVGISLTHKIRNNISFLTTLYASESTYELFLSQYREKRDNYGLSTGLNYFFTHFPGSVYVRGDVKKINLESSEDYYEYNLKTGMSVKFAAFPGLLPSCEVEGYVFKDADGNGRFDKGEDPLSDVRIMVAGGLREARTDINGYYNFKKVSGLQTNVAIKMADVPSGYVVTTLANYTMDIKNRETYQCDFGIAISNQIWGRIYADLNDNNKFDPGIDREFPQITVQLQNGLLTKTNVSGFYRFISLPRGEYTVSLDYTRLPVKYYSKETMKRTIMLEEGDVINIDYPFGAERMVMGTVFYDKDANNVYSKEDVPLEGVIVKCAGAEAETTKKGVFVLRKLPFGKNRITVDTDSLPKGAFFEGDWPEVDLSVKPETVRNIFIPIKQK
ncbi:MAG: hypothetical protein JW928_08010 [Candidatus Aureabacteria bacterium]|nr:hypothetical protein [Candidatus Auribacterota bacterium]